MSTEAVSQNTSNRMSSDVDQEIYDDCVSLPNPKPPIMQKPAVNNIAAMFGGTAKKSTGPNKPVAVVQPSQTDKDVTKRISVTPKELNKPTVNVPKQVNNRMSNGLSESKSVSNNNTSSENSKPAVKTGGKLSIPPAFNKPEENSSSKLTDFRNGLKPVGGINSKRDSITKTSPSTDSSKIIVPSKSPNTLQNQKGNTIGIQKKTITSTNSIAEKKGPKSPVAKPMGVNTFPKTQPQSVSYASKIVLLSCDNVKYCQKNKPKFWGKKANKPTKMDNINLGPVKTSRPPDLPRRPPPKGTEPVQTEKKRSIIMEYTEEDEAKDISGGQLEQETYDDALCAPELPARTFTQRHSPSTKSPNSSSSLTSPSSGSASTSTETYDDCTTENSSLMEGTYDEDEVYEDVDNVQRNAALIAKNEERRKELERKEKKEREKKEKDEKKRQKKLEEERKKLKITGDEVALSEGRVRKDSKGSKLDLPLKSGEMVSIIRMTDNPPLKWLAKLSNGKVGYVEISNIEIMQGSLDNVKNASLRSTNAASGVFEEVYDDVDVAQGEDQEIYEDAG